jgi:hypothetical protein
MKVLIITMFIILCNVLTLQAEVKYTDIKPDSVMSGTIQNPMMYFLNIDNYDYDEYIIGHHVQIQFFSGYNESLVLVDDLDKVPKVLLSGELIDNNSGNWYNSMHSSINMSNKWPGSDDKYIGLKFKSQDNKWHYGWLRVTVPADGQSLIFKDYAWETETEKGITAGDGIQGLDVSDGQANNPWIMPNPVSDILQICRLPCNSIVKVYNSMGMFTAEFESVADYIKIDVSNYPSGYYFAKFSSGNTQCFTIIH